jgi:hypothetical protein
LQELIHNATFCALLKIARATPSAKAHAYATLYPDAAFRLRP